MALFRMKPHYRKSGGGTLSKYGTKNITVAVTEAAGASVGNYALIAGGGRSYGYPNYTTTTTYSFDKSLVRAYIASLNEARYRFIGASNNNYAVFLGGQTRAGAENRSSCVDFFDTALVHSFSSFGYSCAHGHGTNTYERAWLAPTDGVFGIVVYDTNLIKTNITTIGTGYPRYYNVQSVDNKVIGVYQYSSNSSSARCTGWDQSLTEFDIGNLGNFPPYYTVAAGTPDYAIFINAGTAGNVRAYDKQFTQIVLSNVPVYVYSGTIAPVTLGNYAIIPRDSYATGADTVYAFDNALTISVLDPLDSARQGIAAATVGNYALFAGGTTTGSADDASSTVDVYQLT